MVPRLRLIRISIALNWLYQGLWCKVLGQAPRHESIVRNVPLLTHTQADGALISLGLIECGLALWALSGWRPIQAALLQTALLITMNVGGLAFAVQTIPEPAGMLFQNFAFLLLVWTSASEAGRYAAK
jgi:DoxX-like family